MSQQPLIIEKNSIIELSRYTSTNKKSNSEWSNNLVTPISVKEGDNILIKQVFIDNKLTDNASVEIPRDMSVKFQFVYYIIAHGLGMYYVNLNADPVYSTLASVNGIDGQPYMLVNQSPPNYPYSSQLFGKPIVEEFTINVSQNIYERGALADLITRQMQSVNTATNNVYVADQLFTTSGYIVPYYQGSTNPPFQNFSVPLSPPPSNQIASTIQKQLYFINLSAYENIESILGFKASLFYLDVNKKPVFCKLVSMAAPSNNYEFTYNNDIDEMLVPFMSANENNEPIPGGKFTFTYNNETYTADVYDCGFIGCQTPALLYNDNQGNEKFSFQLHSPLYQGGNIVVGSYIQSLSSEPPIDNNKISYLQSYAGIMFVNIYEKQTITPQDVELLDILGFSRSDLIPIDDLKNVFSYSNNLITPLFQPRFYFQYSSYLKYTTKGVFPLAALQTNFPFIVPKIVEATTPNNEYTVSLPSSIFITLAQTGFNFFQSTNSTSLLAGNFPISSINNAGHWLIELNAWTNDYVNQDKLMMVKAIVGNYLYGNSFSQTLGPDSLIYTHSGMPLQLAGMEVRLLNPITKQPSGNYIVGPNSSIYLQVVNHNEINEPHK